MITSALVLTVIYLHLHREAHLQEVHDCRQFVSRQAHFMYVTPTPHHVYRVLGRRMYLHVVGVVGVGVLPVLPVDRAASSRACMRETVLKIVHILDTVTSWVQK